MKTKKKKSVLPAVRTVLLCVFLLIGFLCFFSAGWFVRVYGRIGFDSVLYTLTSNLGGVQSGLILNYLLTAALPSIVGTAAVCLAVFFIRKRCQKPKLPAVIAALLSLVLIVYAAFDVELVDYLVAKSQDSYLFEMEYRDPKQVAITFPEKKRNLIYIMLESMETTYLSESDGGAMPNNLIPELNHLALENLNFSHNTGVGGFQEIPGATWTIGAMVAQTGGVPLKTPSTLADRFNGYGKDGVFLPGLTTLTDVLHENGYRQTLMFGSDMTFGGRDAYYRSHGIDEICDIYTARQDGIIPEDYFVWWGMEDLHLYRYAAEKITELAAGDQPFAFTMLTVDTHHVGGYKCELCGSESSEQYDDVISCSSRQVYQFVQWLQQQDFYENTTIIITGDHRTMDNGYISRTVYSDYTRHIYNCFINAAAQPLQDKNRNFTTVDMFPTTLAAMGCTIEGNRLGLGTNLFSNIPTLAEAVGYDAFCDELAKESSYFAENFFSTN